MNQISGILAVLSAILSDYQKFEAGEIVNAPTFDVDNRQLNISVQKQGQSGFTIRVSVGDVAATPHQSMGSTGQSMTTTKLPYNAGA